MDAEKHHLERSAICLEVFVVFLGVTTMGFGFWLFGSRSRLKDDLGMK
jgi:hypothetical protein